MTDDTDQGVKNVPHGSCQRHRACLSICQQVSGRDMCNVQ